jgi:hypothetical protein
MRWCVDARSKCGDAWGSATIYSRIYNNDHGRYNDNSDDSNNSDKQQQQQQQIRDNRSKKIRAKQRDQSQTEQAELEFKTYIVKSGVMYRGSSNHNLSSSTFQRCITAITWGWELLMRKSMKDEGEKKGGIIITRTRHDDAVTHHSPDVIHLSYHLTPITHTFSS